MAEEKKEKKPDLELPELSALDEKTFSRILKACLYNDKDKIIQLSLAEKGKVLIDELNQLLTYLKFKSTKEAVFDLTLAEFAFLDKAKSDIVRTLCASESKKLQDSQKIEFFEKIPILTSVEWRFEVEVSSRQRKRLEFNLGPFLTI